MKNEYSTKHLNQLGLNALQGVDKKYSTILSKANNLLDNGKRFNFYIAKQELTVTESTDYDCYDDVGENDCGDSDYEWDEVNRALKTTVWYDCNGKQMYIKNDGFQGFHFNFNDVMNPERDEIDL